MKKRTFLVPIAALASVFVSNTTLANSEPEATFSTSSEITYPNAKVSSDPFDFVLKRSGDVKLMADHYSHMSHRSHSSHSSHRSHYSGY